VKIVTKILNSDSRTLSYLFRKEESGILAVCPGFVCDRVNFHKQPVGLTQTSQSNSIFKAMWCHAWYL